MALLRVRRPAGSPLWVAPPGSDDRRYGWATSSIRVPYDRDAHHDHRVTVPSRSGFCAPGHTKSPTANVGGVGQVHCRPRNGWCPLRWWPLRWSKPTLANSTCAGDVTRSVLDIRRLTGRHGRGGGDPHGTQCPVERVERLFDGTQLALHLTELTPCSRRLPRRPHALEHARRLGADLQALLAVALFPVDVGKQQPGAGALDPRLVTQNLDRVLNGLPGLVEPPHGEQRTSPLGLEVADVDRTTVRAGVLAHAVEHCQCLFRMTLTLEQQPGVADPKPIEVAAVVALTEQRERTVDQHQRLCEISSCLGHERGIPVHGPARVWRPHLVYGPHEVRREHRGVSQVAAVDIAAQHGTAKPDILVRYGQA